MCESIAALQYLAHQILCVWISQLPAIFSLLPIISRELLFCFSVFTAVGFTIIGKNHWLRSANNPFAVIMELRKFARLVVFGAKTMECSQFRIAND